MAQNTKSDLPVKKNAFVHKLYDMLNNKLISHLIWWADTPEANTFLLCPSREFAEALSSYFKHENVASFVRQLHMYGFHKVSDPTPSGEKGTAIWEFRHSLGKFRKDDEASLVFIKRRLQLNSQPIHSEAPPLPGHPYDMSQYYYKPQYVQFIPNMPMYGAPGVSSQNHAAAYQANLHSQQAQAQALAHNQAAAMAHNQALAHNIPLQQNHQLLAPNVQLPPNQHGQPPPGYAYYPVPIPQQAPGSQLPLLPQQQLPPGFQPGHSSIMFPAYSGGTNSSDAAAAAASTGGYAYIPSAQQPHNLPQFGSNLQVPPPQFHPVFQGHWQGTGGNQAMADRNILMATGAGASTGAPSLPAATSTVKPEIVDILPLAKPLLLGESTNDKSSEGANKTAPDSASNTSGDPRHIPSVSLRPSWSERQSQSSVECVTPVIGLISQSKDGQPIEQWQPRPLEIVQGLPKDGLKGDSPRGSLKPFPLPSISESMYYSTPTLLPAQYPVQTLLQPTMGTATSTSQSVTQTTTQSNTQSNTPQFASATVSDGPASQRLYIMNNSSEPSSTVSSAFPPDNSIPKLPLLDILKANTTAAVNETKKGFEANELKEEIHGRSPLSDPPSSIPASTTSIGVPAATPPHNRGPSSRGFASHLLNDSPSNEASSTEEASKDGKSNGDLNGQNLKETAQIMNNDDQINTNKIEDERSPGQSSPTTTNGTRIEASNAKDSGNRIDPGNSNEKLRRGSSKLEHLLDNDDDERNVKRRDL